jgi:hypothetical protein
MKTPIHLVILSIALAVNCAAWEPPYGIADPADTWTGFGEIDQPTPPKPLSWSAANPSAQEGYYFIDNSDPAATDADNPFGFPGRPRMTPPEGTLAAGTMIYIHGGLYTPAKSAGDRYDWRGMGTPSKPIWITGNPTKKPLFQDLVHIGLGEAGATDYLVIENLEFSGSSGGSIRVQPSVNGVDIRHVLLRNLKIRHLGVAADQGGILVGVSSSNDGAPDSLIEDVVAYNNDISYCGDRITTDTTGFYNGYHTNRVWCVDNVIHHVGADSIAGSHYSDGVTRKTTNYFIGRNTLYGNGENGIDIKGAENVVISQNTIYGPFEREQGSAIVLHYGASPPTTVKHCAVLFNRIYHVSAGISTGSSYGCDNLTVVGNLFYDIRSSYAALSDPVNGACIQLGGSHGVFRIANNTFHDFEKGIYIAKITKDDSVDIRSNVFSAGNTAGRYEISLGSSDASGISSDYNFFTPNPRFFWGGKALTMAGMKLMSKEAKSREGDPIFIDASVGDLASSVFSKCIDNGSVSAGYDEFQTRFGLNIKVDFSGNKRPFGDAWDIGAFEFAGKFNLRQVK